MANLGIDTWIDYLVMAAGYAVLLGTSGHVLSSLLQRIARKNLDAAASSDQPDAELKRQRLAAGVLIGKCENILILSFVLLEAYTALALVVTAKTLVRKEEIEKNELFFLAGTLVNVSYSVLVGFVLKLIIAAVG